MHYGQAISFSPNLIRVSANFTRPADTTAYTSGDLVANSTTAASVVPMPFTAARTVTGLFKVERAKIAMSDRVLTNAQFRLHLFSATPTIATVGDNGVLADNVTGVSTWLGAIDVTIDQAFAAGAAQIGAPNKGVTIMAVADAGRIVYGLLEARAAYTPVSAEIFTITLELTRA